MAKTDANGQFTISNLPVGEFEFQFWHERTGYLSDVAFGKRRLDKRGRIKIVIAPGENDLGRCGIARERFEK